MFVCVCVTQTHTESTKSACVVCGTQLVGETESERQSVLSALNRLGFFLRPALRTGGQSQGTRMKMKRSLCTLSCLVTLVVELSWINMGHSMHREGGNRVSAAEKVCVSKVPELLLVCQRVQK